MKKKSIKNLKLNKVSISSFQKERITGGTIGTFCTLYSAIICPSETCISTAQSGEEIKPSCNNCQQ